MTAAAAALLAVALLLLAPPAAECFPGAARVHLRDGSEVEMRSLRVGDEVAVAGRGTEVAFSRVTSFSRRDDDAEAAYTLIQVHESPPEPDTCPAAKSVRVLSLKNHSPSVSSSSLTFSTNQSPETSSGVPLRSGGHT